MPSGAVASANPSPAAPLSACRRSICEIGNRVDNVMLLQDAGRGAGRTRFAWRAAYFERNAIHRRIVRFVDDGIAWHVDDPVGEFRIERSLSRQPEYKQQGAIEAIPRRVVDDADDSPHTIE